MRFLALLILAAAPALAGEKPLDEIHARLAAAMPDSIRITIDMGEGPFRVAGPIPFVLTVANDTTALLTGSRSPDRRGRPVLLPTLYAEGPGFDGFVPEPAPSGWVASAERLETVGKGIREELDLADSLRVLSPGRWRFFFTGGVIVLGHQVPLVSPIVTIDLLPAEGTPVEGAIADLAGGDPETRARAAALLDRLGTRDALRALIPYLESRDLGDRVWHALLRPRDPGGTYADLEELFDEPGVPVGRIFLRALAHLETRRPRDPPPPPGPVAPVSHRQLLLRLASALPKKDPDALPAAIRALAGAFVEVESPVHLPEAVVRAWTFLTEDERQALLTGPFWPRIRSDAVVPHLKAEARAEGPPADFRADDLRSLAVLRLLELRRPEGRALVLEDLARPRPLLSAVALLALPDETLPALTKTWAEYLRDPDLRDLAKLPLVITRYGTADLVPVVTEVYGTSDAWATEVQAAFLRFLLKEEPGPALDLVRKAVLAREKTGSYRTVLTDVLPFRWTPGAEALALEFLRDEDPAVAADATRALLRHGSDATTAPLTDRIGTLDPTRTGEGALRMEILLSLLGRGLTEDELRLIDAKPLTRSERTMLDRYRK